ncbi:MAG: Asp-tRNA(Asn)/Glu-tRNA(Gln) amidotransferase subunit GatA [Saccharofermentanales bacterium]
MEDLDLKTASILSIARSIRSRKISACEVFEHAAAQQRLQNGSINAFIDFDEDKCLKEAKRMDDRTDTFAETSILYGIPISIKDNICVKGQRTTCASKILEHFIPPYSAAVIEKLEHSGLYVAGKCNMDEFAMGSTSETSAFGAVRNPFNTDYSPGGSSGGSAAAVASGMAYCALGSDTGGSVRQPASFCGVTGLKPTYGSVSRYGLIAYASSLDQIGPIGRSVSDCAALFDIVGGPDPKDSTCIVKVNTRHHFDLESFLHASKSQSSPLKGYRIALLSDMAGDGVSPEIRKTAADTAARLESLGADCEYITVQSLRFSVPAYYVIACAEAGSNLSRYDGIKYGSRAQNAEDLNDLYLRTRTEMFGDEVIRRIMLGSFVLSSGYFDAYYKKALQVRGLIKRSFDEVLGQYDAILMPVSPDTAPMIGQSLTDPLKMYLNDIFTVNANLAGLPAISFPCGMSADGLPTGMQLMGKAFGEDTLFRISGALQELKDFQRPVPAVSARKGGTGR